MRAIRKHSHFSKSSSWFKTQGSVLRQYCSNFTGR